MKAKTKAKLADAERICNEEDRSTEYMIQFMQDYADVDLDCVMAYLAKSADCPLPDAKEDDDGK